MSTVYHPHSRIDGRDLPLLAGDNRNRVLAWRGAQPVSVGAFLARVHTLAASLPSATHVVNLCEDRLQFMSAFCAALVAGQTTLMPPSRAPGAVDEVMAAYPGSYCLGDRPLTPAPPGYMRVPTLADVTETGAGDRVPHIAAARVAAIGFTSGSSGKPQASAKTWGSFHASTAGNLAMLRREVGTALHVVATVPPQHMYGMEMSVLLPLLGAISVHAGRPFFPVDVADALRDPPTPRVLVTTPVHLRALLEAGITLPALEAIISATAPMPVELARTAEQRFKTRLLETFGSTETCIFASRHTARENKWTLYTGARVHPQPDGTRIEAAHLAAAVTLADIVELDGDEHFYLRGRNTDLLEIAGKRASLADLNRRLLAIPGIKDGVIFQLDEVDLMGVRRIAALVVAPGITDADILLALRAELDPVFLPRPLRKVDALPRNETGKLPRDDLLALLNASGSADAKPSLSHGGPTPHNRLS